MTPDTQQARMVILRGDDCISRGDDPLYPLYPPLSARPGLIAKAAVVSAPPARTVILREGAPLYPNVSWAMPSQGPAR